VGNSVVIKAVECSVIRYPKEHQLKTYLENFSKTCRIPRMCINPLNAELHPICHLVALLGAHHIFHVSWIRVNAVVIEGTMQFTGWERILVLYHRHP